MIPLSLNYAPFAAAAAIVLAVVLLLGLNMGVSATTLAIVILGGVTAGLACLTFVQGRYLRRRDSQAWSLRQSVDRMQAMLFSVPGAYCVFTTQGILRDSARIAPLLGVPLKPVAVTVGKENS